MTTAYTSLLGLALPVTGELSGTWGDTVNNAITSLLDTAVAGTTSITTDADITLTTTTGASNQARQAIILWNPASGTTTRNITAPAQSKIYTVINASGGTQSIVLRGVGPTTGVTIVKGESAVCAWNGSDFIKVSNTSGSGTFTNLTVTGNTILGDASADTLTVNATITSNLIFTDNTYDIGASGATRPRTLYLGTSLITPAITNSGLTTGRVVYTTTGGLETSSANLLYSGTDLTVYGLTVGRGGGAVATNTAVGASALSATSTGTFVTGIGSGAATSNTSGGSNTAVGGSALGSNTTGSFNTAVGAGTFGADFGALGLNTTGSNNTAVGNFALRSNTTASSNTAVGYQAAYSNTTGSDNTAVGYQALYSNTTVNANTAFGWQAAYSNTTGTPIVALGYRALYNNTTGSNNAGVGYSAGYSNTTGAGITALGTNALYYNTTGNDNVAVGYRSGLNNTTGSNNIAIGRDALLSNTTASNNTAVGYQAGYSNTTGTENTFVGPFSGYYVTTGSKNTIIGRYSALSAPINQTGSNFVVLSDGDGNIVASSKTAQTFALQGGTLSSGTGIAFPATQSASSDANTLDDYEEGTWTPSLGGNTTYVTQQGQYTKIGRQVTVTANLSVSVLGTGSTTTISGLPFSTNATSISGNAVAKFGNLAVNVIGLNVLALDGSVTTLRFTYISASGGANTYDPALFGNNAGVYFSVTYFVN